MTKTELSPLRRPIWLRKEGKGASAHAVVLVNLDGEWRELIRERLDGEFSHIWEDNLCPQCGALALVLGESLISKLLVLSGEGKEPKTDKPGAE